MQFFSILLSLPLFLFFPFVFFFFLHQHIFCFTSLLTNLSIRITRKLLLKVALVMDLPATVIDLPATEVEHVPEKEKIEDGTEGGPVFHCDLYDTEIVHKIAQAFLPGLSAACVDNTRGGIFKSPGSVAAEIRKEMVDYLIQRSESFVAESVILEGSPDTDVSDHPFDIISDFIDDFASSKRNFFSRVSGWLLSEKREDDVDDFMQEMEMNGFWLMGKREEIAQTMVKNVDFKNLFHCDKKFNTADELAEHVADCGFRTLNCTNEGCTIEFSASQMEKHDSVCPFKIIACEQKCSDYIMRRDMDRHCITVCPMKLMNCPFYSVGCESTVPQCKIQEHLSDNLQTHLLCALKNIHKGISADDLKKRAEQIAESSSDQLARARDVRSVTLRIKNIEVKLGPLEITAEEKVSEESTEALKKAAEESTDASKNVGEDSAKTPETVSEETNKSLENVGEESAKAQENIVEESTKSSEKASEESLEALKKVGEESTEAPVNVSEESMESVKNINDQSTEVPRNPAEESTETEKNASEKSSEALKDVSEESTKTEKNESNKVLENVHEDSTKTEEKASEEPIEAQKNGSEESSVNVQKTAIPDSTPLNKVVLVNVSEDLPKTSEA